MYSDDPDESRLGYAEPPERTRAFAVHPLEAAALRLIGVPYLQASHQPEAGLDCAGFVYVALRTAHPTLHIDLPRVRPMRGTPLDALYAITEPVALHARRPGDIAVLRLGPEALPLRHLRHARHVNPRSPPRRGMLRTLRCGPDAPVKQCASRVRQNPV